MTDDISRLDSLMPDESREDKINAVFHALMNIGDDFETARNKLLEANYESPITLEEMKRLAQIYGNIKLQRNLYITVLRSQFPQAVGDAIQKHIEDNQES